MVQSARVSLAIVVAAWFTAGAAWGAVKYPPTDTPAGHLPWWHYAAPSPSGAASRIPPPQEHPFGYPTHTDPLFDHGNRPSWAQQHLEPRNWERPIYDPPSYGQTNFEREPIRKPVYQPPLLVMPNDNKPLWNIKNYQAPAAIKPTDTTQRYLTPGTNYVIDPYYKPARQWPTYDQSTIYYNRPEYQPPVYVPQEYKHQQDLAPPAIAPAR